MAVEQAETQLRVEVPIEEEECRIKEFCIKLVTETILIK
jgi:hypothetical protein